MKVVATPNLSPLAPQALSLGLLQKQSVAPRAFITHLSPWAYLSLETLTGAPPA